MQTQTAPIILWQRDAIRKLLDKPRFMVVQLSEHDQKPTKIIWLTATGFPAVFLKSLIFLTAAVASILH